MTLAALLLAGFLHLPCGHYEVSETLLVPVNGTLEGEGACTELVYTGPGIAIVVRADNGYARATIRGFRLTTKTGRVGIRVLDASTVTIAELPLINGFSSAAIHLTSNVSGLAINIVIREVFAEGNPGHGFMGDAAALNHIVIVGSRAQGNGGCGVFLWGGNGIDVIATDLEGNWGGQYCSYGGSGKTVIGGFRETLAGQPMWVGDKPLVVGGTEYVNP